MNHLLFVALFSLVTQPASSAPSQEQAPAVMTDHDAVFAVGELLRCPVCQGMPIAESPSQMAQDMMQRVRELHAEGKSQDEILDYFAARYGEWVLLEPKTRGFSVLVWILPPLALILGLYLVLSWRARKGQGQQEGRPTQGQEGSTDPYVDRIRREVGE